MKAAILYFAIIIGGIIALPSPDKNISGTWILRSDENLCNSAVLRIKMQEGRWTGKADIPAEELYDKEIYSIAVERDSVFIRMYKDGPTIKARMVNDSTITGKKEQEGRTDGVEFKKN